MDQYNQGNGPVQGQPEPTMDLKGQPEADFGWAPPGRYPLRIVKAEGQYSKAGAPMLHVQAQIEVEEFSNVIVFDYMITARGAKGAGFGVKKLKGLGINTETEVPVPLSQIANSLLGKLVWADLTTKPRMGKDANGDYTQAVTAMVDGKQVQAMNNSVDNYYAHAVAAIPQQLPTQTQAPQFQAPQQAQYAPQAQQAPVQYAQPVQQQAPQYAQPVQQAVSRMPIQDLSGQAPVQQPVQQLAPQGPNGGGFAQFPPGGAPAPWMQQAPTEAPKGRKPKAS
jgi:hypothetical protein